MVDRFMFIRLMVGGIFHCHEGDSKFGKGILWPSMCQ